MEMKASAIPKPLAAVSCIVAAMAIIGLIDNFVILIAELAGLWQLHLVRACIAIPLILLIAGLGGWPVAPKRLWAVTLRSLLVSVSMVFYFGSLAFLPVAQAAAGLFTAPIFVLLISVTVFGRRVGAVNVIAAIVGFLGVLLMLRPDFSDVSSATLMPVAAGVFYALGAVATRGICLEEGSLALLLGFFVAMMFWGILGCVWLSVFGLDAPDGPVAFRWGGWVPVSGGLLALISVQAVGSVVGVGLITRGYLLAEATFVTVFEYTLLVFAAFWGYVVLNDRLDIMGAVGIALIMLSGGFLARVRQGAE